MDFDVNKVKQYVLEISKSELAKSPKTNQTAEQK